VFDGDEPFGRPSADPLRGRIGRDKLGMLFFELAELTEESIELCV
jgi:hypothetical protein